MSGIKRTREPQQSFNESFGNLNCILNICTALPDIEPESKKGHFMVHNHTLISILYGRLVGLYRNRPLIEEP